MASEMIVCNPLRLFTPKRLDLVIKWRMFRHWLNGTYPQAEQDYLWHIDQRAGSILPIDVYIPKAYHLFNSMKDNGFDPRFAVPVNKQGTILDAAHRTACAAALGIDVPVDLHDTQHQWPDWGSPWLSSHGMTVELPGIIQEYERLTENVNGRSG